MNLRASPLLSLFSIPLLVCSLAALAAAQNAPWPSRPIRIVAPDAPGSGNDVGADTARWRTVAAQANISLD